MITDEQSVHKHTLPKTMINAMKIVYRDLTDARLLGKSQNANEHYSNRIWQRIQKTTIVGLNMLYINVIDVVICFSCKVTSRQIMSKGW